MFKLKNNMITVYTIAYNEEFMLPFFIRHYRTMFPDCRIVVYDNESTDRTVEIAQENNCEVITYKTDNKLSDQAYLDIKNNCWKSAETDWVLIADVDEHVFINEYQLQNEQSKGVSVIEVLGYNMVNQSSEGLRNFDISKVILGVRAPSYDKVYLFDKRFVTSIKYNPGAHTAVIVGFGENVKSNSYICRHYKYIDIDYMIARHAVFASRLSEDNLKNHWGTHYLYTPEQIRNEFEQAKRESYVVH